MSVITRFAPSPTGYLHIGHAYSAAFAAHAVEMAGGAFLLRLEDIDPARCRPAFAEAILEDLAWLGLTWPEPVWQQSARMAEYDAALSMLREKQLLYPCFCTRRDIQLEIAAAGYAPHEAPSGPDGLIYPGTCRDLSDAARADRMATGDAFALRLDMARAKALVGELAWTDRGRGTVPATPEIFGDVVLARKDVPTSYHLAVTVDDAAQQVSLVTRGEDLLASTHVHRLLQALLGLETPEYHHHPLLLDAHGKRFAKRDRGATLRDMRRAGQDPGEIMRGFGLS